jgi:thiol-disulfide isomerase/thioredoxin
MSRKKYQHNKIPLLVTVIVSIIGLTAGTLLLKNGQTFEQKAAASYDSTVLLDHPVGYWAMNNQTGTETDLSGRGHDGTYFGGIPTLTTLQDGEEVARFNGTSQYLTIPSSSDFSIPTTKELTWEGWIRPDTLQFPKSSTGYADWMGKCATYSPTCEWEARMYDAVNSENRYSRISAYVFNPNAGLGSAADWQPVQNLLQSGQWLHVVGEYQTVTTPTECDPAFPGTINIWVNGVKQNFAYHSPTGCMSQYGIIPQALTSPLNIGTMAKDFWFKGAIGKVAIYNYLLSQAQIDSHFTAMTGIISSGSCADTCTIPMSTVAPFASTTPKPTSNPKPKHTK